MLVKADSELKLRQTLKAFRGAGESIAFVPTMGFLHEGHLSLVRTARRYASRVVVSIFVNPAQLNDPADFEKYPIDLVRDEQLLVSEGVDVLFIPTTETIYGSKKLSADSEYQSWVSVDRLTQPLEGAHRPGHFRGVTTVVSVLFNLVQPDVAVFGEKDFRQLRVIEQMVLDLKFPIKIVRGELVREPDGLAMSSRNVRLSPAARSAALSISRGLMRAQQLFKEGELVGERACSGGAL